MPSGLADRIANQVASQKTRRSTVSIAVRFRKRDLDTGNALDQLAAAERPAINFDDNRRSIASNCYGANMAKYDEFKTPLPRSQQAIVARCFGTPEMFLPEFNDMPKALQDAFRGELSIPCEGGGRPGQWCSDCVFGEIVEVDPTELLDLL